MKTSTRSGQNSATVIVTLATLAGLTVLAAFTLQRVAPKFRMSYQNAAWQEARLGAEAGIDAAIGDLLENTTGSSAGTWRGWKQNSDGVLGPVLTGTLSPLTNILSSLLGSPSGTATSAQPIFLDNLNVSTATGVPTEVDVQLWALPPAASADRGWFRIRAMATCALGPTASQAPDHLDASLRRFSLRTVRPQLRKDDVGASMTIPTPNISRTIEVLVEPIRPFELALWTDQSLSLGTTGTWRVDSYDSSDARKSNPDGTYPGLGSSKVGEHGHVASNLGRPAGALCGPLISANGARVFGVVATNGGDNPATVDHENVAGAIALEPGRIRDDFCREMKPVARPASGDPQPEPLPGMPFFAGTESAPATYAVAGDLDAFTIEPPPDGAKGLIIILVNGNLDVHEAVDIPPRVTAVLYVRGNIDFHGHAINAGPASSNRPGQLQIYGEDSGRAPRTLKADGDAAIRAAFYGPNYDVRISGGVEWCGAIACRSFATIGGGTGGIHYDEALGRIGPPVSFRIARYVEDVRE